jgi:hypothetical protein
MHSLFSLSDLKNEMLTQSFSRTYTPGLKFSTGLRFAMEKLK